MHHSKTLFTVCLPPRSLCVYFYSGYCHIQGYICHKGHSCIELYWSVKGACRYEHSPWRHHNMYIHAFPIPPPLALLSMVPRCASAVNANGEGELLIVVIHWLWSRPHSATENGILSPKMKLKDFDDVSFVTEGKRESLFLGMARLTATRILRMCTWAGSEQELYFTDASCAERDSKEYYTCVSVCNFPSLLWPLMNVNEPWA